MPKVNLSFDHGQEWEAARKHFQAGITRAQAQHGFWIRQVEWSNDQTSARLSGPGYTVQLTVDERQVHVSGTLPFFPKLIEGRVRKFVAEELAGSPPSAL